MARRFFMHKKFDYKYRYEQFRDRAQKRKFEDLEDEEGTQPPPAKRRKDNPPNEKEWRSPDLSLSRIASSSSSVRYHSNIRFHQQYSDEEVRHKPIGAAGIVWARLIMEQVNKANMRYQSIMRNHQDLFEGKKSGIAVAIFQQFIKKQSNWNSEEFKSYMENKSVTDILHKICLDYLALQKQERHYALSSKYLDYVALQQQVFDLHTRYLDYLSVPEKQALLRFLGPP